MARLAPKTAPYSLPDAVSSSDPVRARDIWTDRGTEALFVGDVVLVTEQTEVQLRVDDRTATRWGGRKAPEKRQHEGMSVKRRCLRRTVATVVEAKHVHIGRSKDMHRVLRLCTMWSGAEVASEALPVGRKFTLGQDKIGRDRLKRVERLVGSGPTPRTDEAGTAMLRARLLTALGPDPVAALARLVDPRTAQANDAVTLGSTAAEMILDGSEPIRMWMISQSEGRMPIPVAEDTDARRAADDAKFASEYAYEDDDYDD